MRFVTRYRKDLELKTLKKKKQERKQEPISPTVENGEKQIFVLYGHYGSGVTELKVECEAGN